MFLSHFKDLMQDEEHDYTVEKLWGLGPIKKEAPVENPEDVFNFERYKVILYAWSLKTNLWRQLHV